MTDTAAPAATPRPAVLADGELAGWDAVHTAEQIAAGHVTAREVLDAAIDRVEHVNPRLAALLTPAYDRGRAEIQRATTPHSPLFGVPTAVKDLSEHAGVRTTFGSRAAIDHVSRKTSAPVAQLLATGLVSVGKSAAPEFGMTATAETPGFPPTRNPWNPAHSIGGSSSGAAALVASRALPIAHASDGGGSIRIPAACGGLVGLKPTYGRLVEPEDMKGLPVKLVSDGVVTRTVRDTCAFMAAAERVRVNPRMPTLGDIEGPGTRRLRIAVVTDSPAGPVDAEVVTATRRTGDALDRLGHHVQQIPQPFTQTLTDDFLLYWGMLAQGIPLLGLQQVGRSFKPSQLDNWTKGLGRHFRRNLPRVPATIRRLQRFASEYAETMRDWDVVVCPTLGLVPPELGWLSVDLPFEEHLERVTAFVPFTPAWNVSGAPAISMPMYLSRSGLPIGVQLGGAFGDDRTLLELALELEQAEGFNQPLPT